MSEKLVDDSLVTVVDIADRLESDVSISGVPYADLLTRILGEYKEASEASTSLYFTMRGAQAIGESDYGLSPEKAHESVMSAFGDKALEVANRLLTAELCVYALAVLSGEYTPFTPKDREQFNRDCEDSGVNRPDNEEYPDEGEGQ